ncbi:hypothetical protein EJB05_09310 [Eragrostis curvula]|uniref:Uncharacterized protein n=1 Tax=Eragrostis curvula TaxID=38414 RepID=A0A5J9W4M7_9POAL|nr:hypothetical protein EJB05_09269 [Eragrostis curvula]TVU42886.1 hypothetical protein EJB05_09310 [Eragrostis curvula]
MVLVKNKDTRALFMVALIVVMTMVVSSPCAVASNLRCFMIQGCTDQKCRECCNNRPGYTKTILSHCFLGVQVVQPESFLNFDKCCCLYGT